MNLFELLSLNPISAMINIVRRSNEFDERGDIHETIIGSVPYHPPEDSGQSWDLVDEETQEYTRVIRKRGE